MRGNDHLADPHGRAQAIGSRVHGNRQGYHETAASASACTWPTGSRPTRQRHLRASGASEEASERDEVGICPGTHAPARALLSEAMDVVTVGSVVADGEGLHDLAARPSCRVRSTESRRAALEAEHLWLVEAEPLARRKR